MYAHARCTCGHEAILSSRCFARLICVCICIQLVNLMCIHMYILNSYVPCVYVHTYVQVSSCWK